MLAESRLVLEVHAQSLLGMGGGDRSQSVGKFASKCGLRLGVGQTVAMPRVKVRVTQLVKQVVDGGQRANQAELLLQESFDVDPTQRADPVGGRRTAAESAVSAQG